MELYVECAACTAQLIDLNRALLCVEILLTLHSAVGFNTALVNKNAKATVCVVAAVELVSSWSGWTILLRTLVALDHNEIGAVVRVHVGGPSFSNLIGRAGKALHFGEVKRGWVASASRAVDATGAWRVVARIIGAAAAVVSVVVVVTIITVVASVGAASIGIAVVWVGIGIGVGRATIASVCIRIGRSGVSVGVHCFGFVVRVLQGRLRFGTASGQGDCKSSHVGEQSSLKLHSR